MRALRRAVKSGSFLRRGVLTRLLRQQMLQSSDVMQSALSFYCTVGTHLRIAPNRQFSCCIRKCRSSHHRSPVQSSIRLYLRLGPGASMIRHFAIVMSCSSNSLRCGPIIRRSSSKKPLTTVPLTNGEHGCVYMQMQKVISSNIYSKALQLCQRDVSQIHLNRLLEPPIFARERIAVLI